MQATSLRPRLLHALGAPEPQDQNILKGCPIVVFGPESAMALMHLGPMIAAGARVVLCVDDFCPKPELHGVAVVRSAAFVQAAAKLHAGAVMVDFTAQPLTQATCRRLGAATGLPVYDLLQMLAAYQRPGVYQTVNDMRSLTVARADDWLTLADRLADDFSRETLYALLLQRLEYHRGALRGVNIWGRDEYFGTGAQSDTFVLGRREHFVDCGAHRGTIIQKLLGATDGHYASLHAFEPDEQNYAHLVALSPTPLENFHCHRNAVSDQRETLRFAETGTMGSHVTTEGNITIEAVAVDDHVDQASFIKMDVEGFEARVVRGAARLITSQRPRMAIASYHYAHDLLDIAQAIDQLATGYHFRIRQHYNYYYDSILYASPREDWLPEPAAA